MEMKAANCALLTIFTRKLLFRQKITDDYYYAYWRSLVYSRVVDV